jgi:hypothetical protein
MRRSEGGGRSAGLRQMNQLDDGRYALAPLDGRLRREPQDGEVCELRRGSAGTGPAEYAVIGVRVIAVRLVSGVPEQLRGEAVGADLECERRRVCGHETRRDERPHGKRRQHETGEQPAPTHR